ncbi:hypothetical protein [Hymenobacter tenuis]
MRLAEQGTHVELPVDSRGAHAAIRRVNPADGTDANVRDFPECRDREYPEEIG